MNKSILMQKQVKDNADDLQKEFLDMKNWEKQMREKDEELRREASGQTPLPPIRRVTKAKTKSISNKQNGTNTKAKRIKSYDYAAWDEFDADKACKDLDKEEQSEECEGETTSKKDLTKAYQEATKHKNEGNLLVQQQKWAKAVGCYNEAIKIFPYDAIFYANRALCQLKLDNFHAAESDCSAAIQLDENYVKAYHRRATARVNLKQYKEAKSDLKKVLTLEPSNLESKSLLAQIEKKIKFSETGNVLKEDTKISTGKVEIERRIGEKMWNHNVPSLKATDTINLKETKDMEDIMNNKQTIEEKKDIVREITVKKKKNPRIPDWLPEKDDVTVIEPIEKPPHLRSKKSLTRITVEEVDFNNIQYNRDSNKIISNKIEPVQKEKTFKDDIVKTNTSSEISHLPEDISIMPPVPKTAVQFIMTWRAHKSSEFRFKYMKQLPEDSFIKIFQDSMESDILSEIIEILRTEFINRKTPAFTYLKSLSEVKRFRALIMFISSKDKENLQILFEHCKAVENVPQDVITALRNKYEI